MFEGDHTNINKEQVNLAEKCLLEHSEKSITLKPTGYISDETKRFWNALAYEKRTIELEKDMREYLNIRQSEHFSTFIENRDCIFTGCLYQFSTLHDVMRHWETTHWMNNLYTCKNCKSSWNTLDSLEYHITKKRRCPLNQVVDSECYQSKCVFPFFLFFQNAQPFYCYYYYSSIILYEKKENPHKFLMLARKISNLSEEDQEAVKIARYRAMRVTSENNGESTTSPLSFSIEIPDITPAANPMSQEHLDSMFSLVSSCTKTTFTRLFKNFFMVDPMKSDAFVRNRKVKLAHKVFRREYFKDDRCPFVGCDRHVTSFTLFLKHVLRSHVKKQ